MPPHREHQSSLQQREQQRQVVLRPVSLGDATVQEQATLDKFSSISAAAATAGPTDIRVNGKRVPQDPFDSKGTHPLAAVQTILSGAGYKLANTTELIAPSPADNEQDVQRGRDKCDALDEVQALKAAADAGEDQLRPALSAGSWTAMFAAMMTTLTTQWPENFHDASKMMLIDAITKLSAVNGTNACDLAAVEAMGLPQTMQRIVDTVLETVRLVDGSKPALVTSSGEFVRGDEVREAIGEMKAQITALQESKMVLAEKAVQKQLKEELEEGITDASEFEQENLKQQRVVCAARKAVMDRIVEYVRSEFNDLFTKLDGFSGEITSSKLKFMTTRKAVVHKDGETRTVSEAAQATHNSAASAAHTFSQLALEGKGRTADVATALFDAISGLKQQAASVRARETEVLISQGFDAEIYEIYNRSDQLKARQTAAIQVTAELREALHQTTRVITTATSTLVETCGSWEHQVDTGLTLVLQAKEQFARELYVWTKVQVIQPAMKRQKTSAHELEMAAAKLAYEEEVADPDDMSDFNTAAAKAADATTKDAAATARLEAVNIAFAAVLTDVDYDELRAELEKRKVVMVADPRKVKPTITTFKTWVQRLADGVLQLTN